MLEIADLTDDVSEIANQLFLERHGLEDAFQSVRDLIGSKGLVSQETYNQMKESEVKILSKVSLVESREQWCFACISTRKDGPPIWVLIDGRGLRDTYKGIETDLGKIVQFLKERLPDAENEKPDKATDSIVFDYLKPKTMVT